MHAAHRKLLNASGFAFQLAIEYAVQAKAGGIQSCIVGREHPWSSGSAVGFADIALSCVNLFVVVECKRTRDAAWTFLMADVQHVRREVMVN
jgi:hypothetical protein